MKQVDLEPHEFRPRSKPRMWSRKLVFQFGVTVACIEALATYVLLTSPQPVATTTFLVVAMLTWPWMLFLGMAIGYLVPHHFFSDDKQP